MCSQVSIYCLCVRCTDNINDSLSPESAPVVDICPSFRLTYNTVSHHCNSEQGGEIKRWTEEVNALEREKTGRGGVINVYDVMHLVELKG